MGTRLLSVSHQIRQPGAFFKLRVCFFSSDCIIPDDLAFLETMLTLGEMGGAWSSTGWCWHSTCPTTDRWFTEKESHSSGSLHRTSQHLWKLSLGFKLVGKMLSCWWPSWNHMGIAWWRMESTQRENGAKMDGSLMARGLCGCSWNF